LAAYPQPLGEDLNQLATPGLLPPFSNQRHAVIQVAGEKEVLLHYRELCKVALQLIDSDDFLNDEVCHVLVATWYQAHQYACLECSLTPFPLYLFLNFYPRAHVLFSFVF